MGRTTHNPVEYTGDDVSLMEDGNEYDELKILDMMSPSAVTRHRMVQQIEAVPDFHGVGDKLAYEQFMQQPVVIKIHRATDKNAYQEVPIGINGDQRWFPRGIPIRIPRMFLERIAQCQPTSVETVENHDRASANGMIEKTTTAHQYPVDVIMDPSPYGRRWLARMNRQG
jgi:hypothetical protein